MALSFLCSVMYDSCMKKTLEFDIFCHRQLEIVHFLDRRKIIKVTGYYDFYNEITSEFECKRLQVEINSILEDPFCFAINHGLDKDGKERIRKLMEHQRVTERA